jgi:hypothetical protein
LALINMRKLLLLEAELATHLRVVLEIHLRIFSVVVVVVAAVVAE